MIKHEYTIIKTYKCDYGEFIRLIYYAVYLFNLFFKTHHTWWLKILNCRVFLHHPVMYDVVTPSAFTRQGID